MEQTAGLQALGVALLNARKAQHRSLQAVARPGKISPAYLQKLEKGLVKSPSPHVLQRLATVLEASYETLMELAGYASPGVGGQSSGPAGGGKGAHRGGLHGEIHSLSAEEQRAVAAFIAFLKAQRPQA